MKYIIKIGTSSYFHEWVGIGPMFVPDLDDAKKFDTREDASRAMLGHSFAFTMADIVEVPEDL